MRFTGDQTERGIRLRIMDLDADAIRVLTEFWRLAEPEMPEIVSDFYHHVIAVASIEDMIGADTACFDRALTAHLDRLLSGRFDDSYFESAQTIGQLFHRIGLEPRWYLGGYNRVQGRLIDIALRQTNWSREKLGTVIKAVNSAMTLDMDITISVYVASIVEVERARRDASVAYQARQHIARLLAGLPAAIYTGMLAPGGAVTRFAIIENAERLTGFSGSLFPSWQAWSKRTEGVSDRAWRGHFSKVATDGDAAIEYDFRQPDDVVVRFRDQARVIERFDDGMTEIVGYVSDITRDHVVREKAFTSAKLATLGEMATGLAHELNQPVAIMSLAAENSSKMLQAKGAEGIDFTVKRLKKIKDQAARARTVIDHLRVFGGKGTDTSTAIGLADAVEGALSLVGAALRGAGIDVINLIDDNLPRVSAGLILAQQVLVNLMLNARDAMENNPSHMPRELFLRSSIGEDLKTLSLTIRDTGPGIPPSIRGRLFEPFFTTKEMGKAAGIGLSLCHGIMSRFAGTISAENDIDGGAAFTLNFNIAEPIQSPLAVACTKIA
jgi:signal transduction histidine kinase